MISCLQINLNHCGDAHNMHDQTAAKRGDQILFLSDQLRDLDDSRWVTSTDGTCAVALTVEARYAVDGSGAGLSFAWLQCGGRTLFSCYWTSHCYSLLSKRF